MMFELWNGALIDTKEVVAISTERRFVGGAWGIESYLVVILTLRGGGSITHSLPTETRLVIEYRPAVPTWWTRLFTNGGEMTAHEVQAPNLDFTDAEASIKALRDILTR